jgi:hypothetical protein
VSEYESGQKVSPQWLPILEALNGENAEGNFSVAVPEDQPVSGTTILVQFPILSHNINEGIFLQVSTSQNCILAHH